MADSGNNNEDFGLVSGGTPLVVFCLQVDDEDVREMVAPRRSLMTNSRGVARFAILLGAMEDSRRKVLHDGGWRRFRSLVTAMEALQVEMTKMSRTREASRGGHGGCGDGCWQ
ncbi:hypothetical protein V8G54_009003 [Vigna mungo]|uniref:Uncharacterized protein n=1 Tax=Vigna mungo TaxID=3915 RepID=A0AAQ3P662_VIGMU